MRKRYTAQWHGIRFEDFTTPSSRSFVDEQFFGSFYKLFFERYRNWKELPPEWVILKRQAAEFLKGCIADLNTRILSIGCGIGIIEKYLIEEGYRNLEITEVVQEPLAWIRHFVAPEKIHLGHFPACVQEDGKYDLIYLAGVECLFVQEELIRLLKSVRSHLTGHGLCTVLSWTYEPCGAIHEIRSVAKEVLDISLETLRLGRRGQFFGYSRNRNDFYEALTAAGFIHPKSGLLDKITRWQTFWIEGKMAQVTGHNLKH